MSPAVAVVSAGRHNAFGHPNPEVLRRYAEAGAVILQTSEVGAVSVRSDGRRVVVESQRGPTFVVGRGSAALHRGRRDARGPGLTLAFGRLLDPRPLTLHLVRRYISERHTPRLKAPLELGEPS